MSYKVTSLTAEQQAKFSEYVKKFVEIGLSTKPFTPETKEHIKDLIGRAYKSGGLKPPKEVIFFDNPITLCKYAKDNGDKNVLSGFLYGSMDASWLSYYSFFINETPEVTGLDIIKPLIELAGLCSYWKPYEKVALVSQNPTSIMKNSSGLHNADGPALTYAGTEFKPMYYMNGIQMPEWVCTTPKELLDAKEIMKLKNVDQRREALRKIGPENLMKQLSAKVLDKELVTEETKSKFGIIELPKNLVYELLEFNFGDRMITRYLKMDNPSVDLVHIEGVPNTCNTVLDALAFRNEKALEVLGIKKWTPPKILT